MLQKNFTMYLIIYEYIPKYTNIVGNLAKNCKSLVIEYWIFSEYIYTWLNGLIQAIFKYKQLWNEVRNNKHRTSSLRWRQDRKLISTTCYMTRFDNVDLLVSFPLQVWCKNFIGIFFVLRYRIIFLCILTVISMSYNSTYTMYNDRKFCGHWIYCI